MGIWKRKRPEEKLENITVCEKCGLDQLSVYDTRKHRTVRIRRKECNACGHRSVTYEVSARDFETLLQAKNRESRCINCRA